MKGPSQIHYAAMEWVIKYCVDTPRRGWLLKPNRKWGGKSNQKFRVSGRSDSDYAKYPATRRSVSGHNVRLEGAVVICKSGMQRTTTLSVTEAETVAAVTCVQDMMFVKNIIESMGLEVKLPMRLEIDNKGAVDLVHNFSVGGRTKHMEIRLLWMRELKGKELSLIHI